VRTHHNIIHAALKHGVLMKLLAADPADVVVQPRVTSDEMTAPEEVQTAATLRAAYGTTL